MTQNPGFCMVVLRFEEDPGSEEEAEKPVESLTATINESAPRTGVWAMCVAVSGWEQGSALATFLVIEKQGDDTRVNNTFRHALTKLDLDGTLAIADRKERLGNVQEEG